MLDKPKKGGTEGGHVDPPEIFAPSPVGTDRSRKMMQVAPTDAPKSSFWSQNRLRNMFGHLARNLAPGRGGFEPTTARNREPRP